MKQFFLLALFLSIGLISCKKDKQQLSQKEIKALPTEQQDSIKEVYKKQTIENTHLHFQSEVVLKKSNYVIFPTFLRFGGKEKSLRSSLKRRYKGAQQIGVNMLFYNTETKKYHALLKHKKARIHNFHIYKLERPKPRKNNGENVEYYGAEDDYYQGSGNVYNEYYGDYARQFIFYEIKLDYNNDKVLDGKDPEYLFITDLEGKNFTQITPPNTDLISWSFPNNSNIVIIKALEDRDGNKKFYGSKDKVEAHEVLLEVDLTNPQMAKRIFSLEFDKALKEKLIQ